MKIFKKIKSQNKGFTLIELMVVVAIIALLSSIAIVSVGPAISKSRDARRKADVKAIQTACELYYQENATYPSIWDNVNSSTSQNWLQVNAGGSTPYLVPKYMGKSPRDPINDPARNYVYRVASPWGGTTCLIYVHLENANDPDLLSSQACYGDTPNTCWGPDGYWYKVGK